MEFDWSVTINIHDTSIEPYHETRMIPVRASNASAACEMVLVRFLMRDPNKRVSVRNIECLESEKFNLWHAVMDIELERE